MIRAAAREGVEAVEAVLDRPREQHAAERILTVETACLQGAVSEAKQTQQRRSP